MKKAIVWLTGIVSFIRSLFVVSVHDTRTIPDICDARYAFAQKAEKFLLDVLTITLGITLATVLGLLVYGSSLSVSRLIVVVMGFVVAYVGVFASFVAYTNAKCDRYKISRSYVSQSGRLVRVSILRR